MGTGWVARDDERGARRALRPRRPRTRGRDGRVTRKEEGARSGEGDCPSYGSPGRTSSAYATRWTRRSLSTSARRGGKASARSGPRMCGAFLRRRFARHVWPSDATCECALTIRARVSFPRGRRLETPLVCLRRAGHDNITTTIGYVKIAEDVSGSIGEPFQPLPSCLVSPDPIDIGPGAVSRPPGEIRAREGARSLKTN
jgi:hypothetical protein